MAPPSRVDDRPVKTLLVNPDPEARRRLEPVLRSRGQDVTVCADAGAALAAAAAPFDLVVVDLTAPGLDGLDVCRRLRNTPDGAWSVVLVITGSSRSPALDEAIRLGADDYLLQADEAELLDLRLTIADRKVQDNTARRRMMNALRESEERFRQLLETAPDAIFLVNRAGVMELMNAQAEALSGYAPAELLGQPVEVLVPEAFREGHVGHRERFFEQAGTRPLGAALNLALRHKDGSKIPVDISLAAQPGPEPAHAITPVRDITEHLRREEELRQAMRAAEEAYERIRRDLQLAAVVQRGLLPARPPGTERIHLAWEYQPCAELGGDGLGAFWLRPYTIGLYLLDVSGHGVAAALLSVSLAWLLSPAPEQSALLGVPREEGGERRVLPPVEVACHLNRWLLRIPAGGRFVTLIVLPHPGMLPSCADLIWGCNDRLHFSTVFRLRHSEVSCFRG